MTKARNGFWHSYYFTTQTFHEPIRIGAAVSAITESTCRRLSSRHGGGDSQPTPAPEAKPRACAAIPRSVIASSALSARSRRLRPLKNDSKEAKHHDPQTVLSATRIALLAAIAGGLATIGVTFLLVNIFERKQEAKNPFFRVVELTDETEDPASGARTSPFSTTPICAPSTRCARASAAARPFHAPPPRRTRAGRWPSRGSRKTRASRPSGPATPSPSTSARSAATPTCSTTRPSPSAQQFKQPGTCLHCHGSVYVPYKKAGAAI
jgi:hypothetical protein